VGAQRQVLIIDDDSGIRDSLADCLEAEGYGVDSACNGAEGLEAARRRRPDVVVVDLLMPVMNGYQFIEAARAEQGLAGVPLVLMTGAVPRADQPLPAVAALLPKPFELDDLLAVVKRLAG
jgi:CheY-like chemotaxis protein